MNPYSPSFYNKQQDGSFRSALRVLPHVFDLVPAQSTVDVGCGVGTWLAAARSLGVTDTVGIDGDYVDRTALLIPTECFRSADLTRPFRCERSFDLALCLEVAEHLPESCAPALVHSLTCLAPVVLFSAAIPKQSGVHHVNEQWQAWWVDHFKVHGYVALDCIRPRIWNDDDVEWWYAQNILLMVREDYVRSTVSLQQEWRKGSNPVALVHPKAYLDRLAAAEGGVPAGVREWLSLGPVVTRASALRLWRRLSRRQSH